MINKKKCIESKYYCGKNNLKISVAQEDYMGIILSFPAIPSYSKRGLNERKCE